MTEIKRPQGLSKGAAKRMRREVLGAVKSGETARMQEVVDGLDEGALPYIYLTAFKIWAIQGGELEGHPHQVLGEILKTRMKLLLIPTPSLEKKPPPPPNPEALVRTVKLDVVAGDTDFCGMRGKERTRFKRGLRSLLLNAGTGVHLSRQQRAKRRELKELIDSLTPESVLELHELASGKWLQDGFLKQEDVQLLLDIMKDTIAELTEMVTAEELAKRQAAAAAKAPKEEVVDRYRPTKRPAKPDPFPKYADIENGGNAEMIRLTEKGGLTMDKGPREGQRVAFIVIKRGETTHFEIHPTAGHSFLWNFSGEKFDTPHDALLALLNALRENPIRDAYRGSGRRR